MKFKCLAVLLAAVSALVAQKTAAQNDHGEIARKLPGYTSEKQFTLIDSIVLPFQTFHTQGLTKVGGYYFLTAVDVKRWPEKYASPVDGFDRDTGEGIGRVFKFDESGKLVGQITIGEKSVYHPGGIDFDGKYIWIPVCEYRPHGNSTVYRMDPQTMGVEKMWDVRDALGAVVCVGNEEVIGMNWDAEQFYKWARKADTHHGWELISKESNPMLTFKIQDAKYMGDTMMLCSGLNRWKHGDQSFALGGIQLMRTDGYQTLYQLPLTIKTPRGASICNNPFFPEIKNGKLRLSFAPDDDHTVVYIYEGH
ncbi:hypothetical protein J2Y45_004002 [Dyadobacter sp. BE34]|uniref:Uncharacterized protein n=1 Tax=Dyadobacter fermentans TaxID=94254 RepID=A0ABU1R1G4_9BACT|nr:MULTISPECIES: DUF6454 family protein [Dyadobacter]MDR6806810.1 hypothetical protein [Dyadobacter fermentans]MDR7044552.1 hypothetical protein [Dyadobacter sp. BE242]MDR7198862.1 hypothetical protein [Dyadobacter sp. BE34]MDR7216824.1 hypothetical protein [Dyadobacter sp. BE31]MDR7263650.1 hypothetical protein [Dyadobacter sp. BE32]